LVIKALDPDWIRIRIGLQPQTLDPDPEKMNMDPKPCISDTEGKMYVENMSTYFATVNKFQ
jgi:hypothetical protein